MSKNLLCCWLVASLLFLLAAAPGPASASGATTELHIIRLASDGATVLQEKTVSYQWMKDNLPVHGDGLTHYYHQGPVFEGDMWDPAETQNLKDKGALMGSNSRDLCDLVGGMQPGDEVSFLAVDGWHTEFAYANVYEPLDRQGPIVLAWYNGEETASGERYGTGYPGLDGFHTAMQIVFVTGTTNDAGQHVFGNEDMRVCLPQEEYQHFYEGLPSTNGLSGKWINRLVIHSQEQAPAAAPSAQATPTPRQPTPMPQRSTPSSPGLATPLLWLTLGLGLVGLLLIVVAFIRLKREAH